jgi:dihydrolipoamide dehydrogenase
MISAVSDVKLNLPKMLAAKNASVTGLTSGIESYLFKKHKIDYVKGTAKFSSPTQLNVALTEGGETMLEAKNVIIATGSEVTPFPGIEIDEKQIVSSTGALDLQEVPKKVSSPGESCLGRGLYRWGLTKLFGGDGLM